MIQEKRDMFSLRAIENIPPADAEALPMLREYAALLPIYRGALKLACTKIEVLDDEFRMNYNRSPVHHIESRIKMPESVLRKMRRKELPFTIDALRAGVLKAEDLPREAIRVLGETTGERINTMVSDIVRTSGDGQGVRMSETVDDASQALRSFMFEYVYMRDWVLNEERKASRMIEMLFGYLMEHPERMPNDYIERGFKEGVERSVADFVAGMTDRYAMQSFRELFLPDSFEKE